MSLRESNITMIDTVQTSGIPASGILPIRSRRTASPGALQVHPGIPDVGTALASRGGELGLPGNSAPEAAPRGESPNGRGW